ncbi:hypothetical protein CIHG_03692 [Coccidioides immitis H538.4]|uniref:Uncharacterized protein n=1 Tax=Coccidioides immitis H538.4 TaxID=396776 RepID=A0A0J8RLH1_COCIT|nr:hypothetical protein CIHG_03692 [Coccidioides immitis H538.4]
MCPAASFAGITPPPRRHTLPAAGVSASKSPNASHPQIRLFSGSPPGQRSQQFQRKRSTPIQAMELRRPNLPSSSMFATPRELVSTGIIPSSLSIPTQLPTRRSLLTPDELSHPFRLLQTRDPRRPHPAALALMRTPEMPILWLLAGWRCARGGGEFGGAGRVR